ncbi:MAG: DUF302 domain-containing protein [Phycisphaerales bacterium]|nr:DUF302 domain-containing protein [Phycisphaerales bacterium]
MKAFEHTVTSEKPFEEAVLAIERKSAEKGFRVLHTHDVAATLAEKGFPREPPVMVLYLAATCVSCFFSSHGFVKLFGVLSLLSFIAAYFVHVGALVSIWCFFAAILSLLIYLHVRFRALGAFPTEPPFPPAIARSTATGHD